MKKLFHSFKINILNKNSYDDSNNNNNHKLINLPHILLNRIIKEIESNLDRICFSLVCKRLYNERNGFLEFKCDKLLISIDLNRLNYFYLKSYQNRIEYSRNKNNSCIAYITPYDDHHKKDLNTKKNHSYDYHLSFNGKQIDIPQSVTSIYCSSDDFNKLGLESKTKSHNVKMITFYKGLDEIFETAPNIWSNIEYLDLKVTSFNQYLSYDAFPSLKSLCLSDKFNLPLKSYSLPPTLESITFGLAFNQVFHQKSLPSKLINLNLAHTYFLQLSHSPTQNNNDNNNIQILPNTLKSISNIPISWLKYLNRYPSVTKISIGDGIHELYPGDIPDTIQSLDMNIYSGLINPGVIPSSIRRLNLGYCRYILNQELLPRNTVYEHLALGNFASHLFTIEPYVLPPNIKKLTLPTQFRTKLLKHSLPDGLLSLSLGVCASEILMEGSLPESLTSLSFSSNANPFANNYSIPPHIKHLSFLKTEPMQFKISDIPSTVLDFSLNYISMSPISKFKFRRLNKYNNDYYIMQGGRTKVQGAIVHKSFFKKPNTDFIIKH